jgi:hypothetical protein
MKKIVALSLSFLFVSQAFCQLDFTHIHPLRKRAEGIKFMEYTANPDTDKAAADDTIAVAKPKHHILQGKNMMSFSQVSYSDSWESGGNPSVTLRGASNLSYTYTRGLVFFQLVFDGAYAMTWESGPGMQKKEDRWSFTNTLGFRIANQSPFYYTALVDLKTQFAPGYKSATDETIISRLFSPAYLTVSLGLSYKYKNELSITLAPVSGRFVLVLDTTIANMGLYEVAPGEKVKSDLGCYLGIVYSKNFLKHLFFSSKLELFSNYTDQPLNIDMDWENKFGFKITPWLTAEFYIRLVYKDKSRYPVTLADGTEGLRGPRMQVNESFNIGLTYAF